MHCAKSDWLVDRDRKGPRLTIRRDASTYSSTRRSSARDHYARLPGAIGATREALIAAFCRLAKSLSHSVQMGWLVGAVGIEPYTHLILNVFNDLQWKGKNTLLFIQNDLALRKPAIVAACRLAKPISRYIIRRW